MKTNKEALISLISQNNIWDVEMLLECLKISWSELISLLVECQDTIGWTLHSHYTRCWLSNLTSYLSLVSKSFEFYLNMDLHPVHCRCRELPYDL